MTPRQATITRNTNETNIHLALQLGSSDTSDINTGVGFLDHMLEQIARHAQIKLVVHCKGDTHIDDHHSTEDIGIALGQALNDALGDKKGITRYGSAYCPLDESLSRVVIDLSGRPGLYFFADFPSEKIGQFDTELVAEFFQGFANHAKASLHIDNLRGKNSHHIAESIFKAFARALRQAITIDDTMIDAIPSTKGAL
ncbi:imidazoleglycerol-phosphate dehydratase HisB [Ostreibacterium oceani]|uniref:Imidazoleglycerol-phosphate dehydratase n=1 Tax=Ostreibacterium oceani TaxID=2654998 RepID=A0A6N7EVB1_9GAMM|nr:imidazoleglycerol-phosphate dehydratase HisB [Ostreibacterium oceani]MPV86704.1 imidazoleglycerol-phosphate dehydratase HisB [Ostreibacterium oceani]